MRALLPSLMLAFAAAAPLSATVEEPEAVSPVPAIAEVSATDRPAAEMNLQEVQLEQRESVADADAAQTPRTGSFWWLVGAIVIAGVILAILL